MTGTFAHSQSPSVHQQIQQTYNFQPHLLSSQEITQKSAVLDQFWTKAKGEPSVYVPALRQELGDFKNPPFFLYDGSMLLLSLSNTPADRKAALAAMAHSDLRDVQTRDYFLQVHRMATLNDDTTAAAFHVLEQPDFKVFIPQHVLTLGQDYVLVYLLLPTDQDYWLQPAIDRLRDEHDQTAGHGDRAGDVERSVVKVGPRLGDEPQGRQQRGDAHGHVDDEDPLPGGQLRQRATHDQADRATAGSNRAPHAERLGPLRLLGERGGDDR